MELALQASKAQQFIRQAVERKIANLARDHDNDCQRGKLRLGNVVQHFQVNDLWATDSQPDFPGAWLARLSKCRDFWYYEQCPTCVGEDIMGGGFQDLREAITKGLEICKGLCLDCVKARRTKSDGTCRVKHK